MSIGLKDLWSLAGFIAVPGLSAIVPLLVYPSVTSSFGADGFSALALGQSVGVACSVACELGWSVIGPQRVAKLDTTGRAELLRSSLASKVVALCFGVPLSVLGGCIVGSPSRLDTALIAASYTLFALSSSWFFTGLNRPRAILFSDVVPKLLFTGLAAAAISFGAPLYCIALANLLAVLGAVLTTRTLVRHRVWPRLGDLRDGLSVVRIHAILTVGRSVSVVYTTLFTGLVGVIVPSAVAGYAATDRLMRMGLSLIGGFPNRLQNWVGGSPGEVLKKRSRRSLLMNTILGAVAGPLCALLLPPFSRFLYSGTVNVSYLWSFLAGTIVLVICLSRGLGLSLVAEGRPNVIAYASIGAAISGVVLLMVLGPTLGVAGALLGVLCAELIGVVVQVLGLFPMATMKRSGD